MSNRYNNLSALINWSENPWGIFLNDDDPTYALFAGMTQPSVSTTSINPWQTAIFTNS